MAKSHGGFAAREPGTYMSTLGHDQARRLVTLLSLSARRDKDAPIQNQLSLGKSEYVKNRVPYLYASPEYCGVATLAPPTVH